MQNQAAMLQCPNESCKAANHESDKYCQQCGTFLLKRYLWAVGSVENYRKDELVAERYLLKSSKIFLDTKPSLSPESVLEIVSTIKPYLKLIPYRLQIPQVYDFLPGKYTNTNIILLEAAAIYSEGSQTGQLLPMLSDAWHEATSFRQLNWLWQIAQLWQPLSSEGVVSSLLNPELLRVEGSLVRLLELQHDLATRPNLSQLGQVWLGWVTTAKPSIAKFMHQLCLAMIEGKIASADLLIAVLDRGISKLGRSHRKLTISTATDTGTSRQRNEDACYPASGTFTTASEALAIVCDGIGGHEGGNVASQLAVETLQHQVKQLSLDDSNLDATTLTSELEGFVRVTNDQISQRNDREHRFGRQRMGTTLVMLLGRGHEIYITHVGDSRAYLITRTGCHQITLDDDVASREVRLGYALYRQALAQASSGSLVQALGMSPAASSLHPTVQRLLLDEDCLFLLCSDGLSDYDRVEEYWDSVILPVFDGDRNLDDAVARLIEVANTQNGHDNVTVALVLCEVQHTEPQSFLSATLVEDTLKLHRADYHPTISEATIPAVKPNSTDNSILAKTKLGRSQRHANFFLPIVSGLLLLLGLSGGLLAYYLLPEFNRTQQPPNNPPSPPSVLPPSITPTALSVGTLLQINRPIQLTQQNAIATPTSTSSPRLQSQIQVPANSVLKVTEKKDDIEQGNLIRLKLLCALNPTINHQTAPSNAQLPPTSNPSLIKLGQEGWIDQASLQPNIHKTLGSSKSDSCPVVTTTTPETPSF